MKSGGGGGRGGGPRGQHRDYDNPNYGQPSANPGAHASSGPATNPAAGASGAPSYGQGQADPYAPCKFLLFPSPHLLSPGWVLTHN